MTMNDNPLRTAEAAELVPTPPYPERFTIPDDFRFATLNENRGLVVKTLDKIGRYFGKIAN